MCEIEWDEWEPFEFFSERMVKAAKTKHTCDCCSRVILPGEPYVRQSAKQDGILSNEKMCVECKQVYDSFNEEHNGVTNPSALTEVISICIDQETYGGDIENAKRWRVELDAITERRLRRCMNGDM